MNLYEKYFDECKEILDSKIFEFNKEKELEQKKKDDNAIKQNSLKPPDFRDNYKLCEDNNAGGELHSFEVFNGLFDNIPYLVYCNKSPLKIKRIMDNINVKQLNGHEANTCVIRYYHKNDKEDFLLSVDSTELLIIWEIQNNYEKKYVIQNANEYINDSIILFNILNKNYIIVSSGYNKQFTKIYEFGEKTPFVKNIFGTKENYTNYIIPWEHKNKYYIIECCRGKITINNLFLDEIYTTLFSRDGCDIYCGFIYNKDYLCVSCGSDYIRVWDLVNKIQYKKIYTSHSSGRGIIPWNNKYVIVGNSGYYDIIDIEEEKIVFKTMYNDYKVCGIKIIKTQLGECLIFSHHDKCINLHMK